MTESEQSALITSFGLLGGSAALAAALLVVTYSLSALVSRTLTPCELCMRARLGLLKALGFLFGLRPLQVARNVNPTEFDRFALQVAALTYPIQKSRIWFLFLAGVIFVFAFPSRLVIPGLGFSIEWSDPCLPFSFILVGLIFSWVTSVYWRAEVDGNAVDVAPEGQPLRGRHIGPEGYYFELCLAFGLIFYLSFALLSWLQKIHAVPLDWWTTASNVIDSALKPMPYSNEARQLLTECCVPLVATTNMSLGGILVDLLLQYAWHILFAAIAVIGGYRGIKAWKSERRRSVETSVLKAVRRKPDRYGGTAARTAAYARVAARWGEDFSFRILRAADRIAASGSGLPNESGEASDQMPLTRLKAALAGYLISAWQRITSDRRTHLRYAMNAILDGVNARSAPTWPVLKNHRAANPDVRGADLRGLVLDFRRAVAEWSSNRSPTRVAMINDALGTLLSDYAESQHDDMYLQEAIEAFEDAIRVIEEQPSALDDLDLASVYHNLGVAESLYGRWRCLPEYVQRSIDHFGKAIVKRDPKPPSLQTLPTIPLTPPRRSPMDAASSYAMRGQSYATLASWNSDDRKAELATRDYASAQSQLEEALGANDFAHFNRAAIHMYAGNLALAMGAPQAALDAFYNARESFATYKGAVPKETPPRHIASLRYALAAIRVAEANLARVDRRTTQPCAISPNNLIKTAVERLQSANRELLTLAIAVTKQKESRPLIGLVRWVKGAALFVEAELCLVDPDRAEVPGNLAGCRATDGVQRCEVGAWELDAKPPAENRMNEARKAFDPAFKKRQEQAEEKNMQKAFSAEIQPCDTCGPQ